MVFRVVLILVGLALLTGLLFWIFPEVQFAHDNWMRYIGLVLILGYLLLSWNLKKISLSLMARSILVWGALAIVLMTGYSFRYEFSDMKAKFMPYSGSNKNDAQMRFDIADDGHFYVRAEINGTPIRFMVDTGASRVVLNPEDAKGLGYKREDLSFNVQSSTANGTVWSALVKIPSLKIGNQIIGDIPASVSQSDLNVSLLGMSFLNKLKGYSVERGSLTFQF